MFLMLSVVPTIFCLSELPRGGEIGESFSTINADNALENSLGCPDPDSPYAMMTPAMMNEKRNRRILLPVPVTISRECFANSPILAAFYE